MDWFSRYVVAWELSPGLFIGGKLKNESLPAIVELFHD